MQRDRRNFSGEAQAGFTLIELVVAMTVLLLLVVLTSQLVSSATSIVTSGNKRMDADGESRLVFTRIAQDVEGMLRRSDADVLFVKNPGNDAFYFYSQTVGNREGNEGPPTPFTFVGYRVANRSDPTALSPNNVLERVGVGLGYDNLQPGKILRLLTYPPSTRAAPSPTPMRESTIAWSQGGEGTPSSPDDRIGGPPTWDNPPFKLANQAPLSSQVFRLEFCFLLKDGTYFAPVAPGAEPWNNPAFGTAMGRIRNEAVGLVLTMALLDEKSQLLVRRNPANNTPDLSLAITAFADGDKPDVAAAWESKLATALASPALCASTFGMPVAAASQIRIYQRSFRLAR